MTFMALPLGPEYDADWPIGFDVFVYDFRTEVLTNVSKRAGLGAQRVRSRSRRPHIFKSGPTEFSQLPT